MSESQTAPNSVQSLLGSAGPSRSERPRWGLPIAYPLTAIPSLAVAIDLAVIVASAIAAELVYHNSRSRFAGEFSHTVAASLFVAALFVATMWIQKLYAPTRLMVLNDQARSVFSAWCGAFLILACGIFTSGVSHELSRGDIVFFWAFGAVALLGHRAFWGTMLDSALKTGVFRGRTIVTATCEDSVPAHCADNLTRHGYRVVAHFRVPSEETAGDQTLDNIISMCRASDIEEIVLFVDPERMTHLRSITRRLRVLPIPVTFVPVGPLSQLFQRARNGIGETVAIELQRAPLSPGEQVLKRSIDIAVSLAALACLSPLFLLVAAAIKLTSPGPVLFRQTRRGFNGRPFNIYKFRSMTVMQNGDVVPQARRQDARVTPVGYWIRRYSIDEVPQLMNVLRGEMSVVGPRPHAWSHDRYFETVVEKYAFRQHAKPGMTGWAQVCGARGETDTLEKMQKRVQLDLWYINNWSVWLDLSILVRTIFVVLSGKNAH
jgi:putative colanic acid biosysnthesis UDP-glucose lipid carrier transferase